MKKKSLLIALLAWLAICIGDIQAQVLPALGMHQNSDEQTPEYDRADANNTYLSGATTKGAALTKATDHEKMTVFGACDLTTYQSAIIIGPNDFPYTSTGSGVTVNATVDVTTLPNTTYSCGGNSFATSSPAWWLNSAAQSIVLNFSVPVTNFSVVVNGTNQNEVFTFNAATGTISLGNFCTDGFAIIGAGNELQATTSSTVGTLITINNPTGSTQYTITHNGFAAGSRISLLDCFEEDPLPYVDPVSNVVACGGEMVSGITFTGTAGATFNWSNNNTATGLAASGTGNIAGFTAANVSTQQVSTITVTPVLGAETGTPINFTITVKPKPSLALGTITNPSTCGGANGSIAFTTTNLPNGTYSLSYTGTGSPQNVTVSGNAFVLGGLSAGMYSNFSITQNGCTGTVAGPVNLQDPSFTWYRDMDGDGFGNPAMTQMACLQPTGYVSNNTDCDDNDALEKPGQVWYKDADGDDYSDGMTLTQCLRPTNYYVAAELIATSGDCNDNNAAINPAATEICDGIDNNCNSMTDEGVQTTYYRDMDGDGFGNPSMTQMACSQPTGYVTNNTDCDDNDALEKPGQVWYKDADGDDYSDGMTLTQCLRPTNYYVAAELIATSGDCNDNNAAINPGATEVCDGIDNDCNTMIDDNLTFVTYYTDADNDSYGTGAGQSLCANPGAGFATQAGDCNDNNAAINPGATEICDGVDNNCNMMTDEGVQTTYYRDMDGDGFGNPAVTQMACSQPMGYVTNNTDCDDNDALEKPGQVWYADVDNDNYSSGTTLTQCLRPAGYKVASELTATTGDCNDGNAAINPAATEICDGIDNNCNSMTDEGVQTTYYRDMDGDGFGNPAMTQMACSQPMGYVSNNTDCDDNDALEKPGQIWYADVDNDNYSSGTTLTQCLRPAGYKVASELTATTGDCNDNNAAINPGATEICDGVDNNCNSMTDEGVQTTYYRDMDGDGFGDPLVTQMACSQPMGYVTNNTDCDDNDALEKPSQVWYKDSDNDNYAETGAATIIQCLRPAGYKAASELTSTTGDCNDGNAAINPAATEVCDGVDNNCNSMTDEGVQTTYYRDMDGDGFGNPSVTQIACSQPMGYVINNTDCDDNDALEKPGQVWYKDADGDDYSDGMTLTQCLRPTNYYVAAELIATSGDCNDNNAAINPGATEICDGIDNNCNSMTDEGVQTTYYRDMDGDGFGNPSMTQMACTQPTGYVTNNTDCDDNDALEKPGQAWYADVDNDGYSNGTTLTQCLRPAGYKVASELTATTGDCNDNNAAINPVALEICNGVDDNCDGVEDEGVKTTYYRDLDGDGFGDINTMTIECSQPTGYVENSEDCDDTDDEVYPGAEEICDSKDNDCNGTIDDIGGTTIGNWIRGDVGDANGSSSFPPCNAEPTDVFTLSSTGFSTSSSDKLHVVYQELCGNGEIIARVLNISGGGWAGIMLRETLNPGSKKVSLKVQANGSIRREIRMVTNGAVNNLNFNRPTHVWLRLTRNGSTFVGYTSPDGSNWTFAFSASVSMNGCIYAGLFSESINASAPTTVTFDNVSIIRPNSNLSIELAQPANLNDQTPQLDMNIYPNPGNGEMTLTVQSATDRPLNLKVMDAFGKIIRNIELNEGTAFNYSLDLSGEPAGIYYLRLRSDDGEENVQRIVLQR